MMLRKVSLAAITATLLLLGLVPAAQSAPLTFGAPVQVNPATVNAQDAPMSVVNADRSITVVWRTLGRDGVLQAARSTDEGKTWSAPVDIAVVRNRARQAVNDTHLRPPEAGPNSTTSTNPRIAADPSRPGWIYIVYGDTANPGPTEPTGGFKGSDHFINYDSQVYFQRSKDNGVTWSTPKRISDPTTYPGSLTIQTRQPTVSVSPGGRVNVVWQDRRHWYMNANPAGGNPALERDCTHSHIYCDDIRLGDTYLSTSSDGGDTFSPNIRVSDRSHNNDVGYDTRPGSGYWSWGPQSVTTGGGWLLVGWMDSREGNWDTDTQDFYLSKVDFGATDPVPQTAINQPDAVSRSVALAKLGYMGGNEGALVGGAKDPANAGLTGAPGGPASRNASRVVIVNETDVAGAMAGTVLARAHPAPVLLSPAAGLPASVKDEITRIRPAGAFVIGDTSKLSDQVVTDIAAAAGILPGQVTRLSGASDAATAALIAGQLDPRVAAEKDANVPAFDAAIIANPATPDAAAAVGLAAARRLPLLYVSQTAVPPETQAAIETLDIKKLIIVGGTDEVSADVATALDALERVTEPITRRGGATQYDTSKEIVTESKERGMPSNVVYVADGTDPMGATLLGGVVARATGMLVLAQTPLSTSGPAQASAFGLTGISRFFLLGPAGAGGAATPASIRPGPNYNLRSDPSKFRGRDQIGLGVNRTNPDHVVAVNANYLDLECEASVSRDGGDTWSRAVALLPADPPRGQAPYSKRCFFHQNVVFGSGQNVYAIVTAGRTGPLAPSQADSGVLVYKSEDGGTTWQRGVPALLEGPGTSDSAVPSPGPNYSRPSIAVDPGAAADGEDLVYAVGRDFVGSGKVRVAVSTIAPPAAVTPPPPPAAVAPPPPPAPAAETPPPPVVGDPPVAVNTDKPVLSKVSLTRKRFKARLGTTIRLTVSKPAKVRIVVARRTIGRRIGRNCVALTPITRRRTPCIRYVTRTTLTRSVKQGANRVRFSGRAVGRFLAPAGYRFTLQARDSANRRSNRVRVTFRVVR